MRSRGPDLATRAAELGRALDAADGRLPAATLAPARTVLERVNERAQLSAEHTVVALAGATGAGKSSVFNALAGAEIARTSRQRPTTAYALAVVAERPELAAGSAALLEWLGVPSRHEVPISAAHPDGLVLLDLPDHDSVVVEHRLRADHITERADLLVWVTNPQKYADGVLHARYLAPLAGHEGAMLVVLNQIDRLSAREAQACLADLERLVHRDGLDARVLATSAHTGQGIAELREVVTRAVARRQAATTRLVAEVRGAAGEILAVLPGSIDDGRGAKAARTSLVDVLEQAAGVPLVADAVRVSAMRDAVARTGWPPTRWLQRFRADPLRTLGLRGGLAGGALGIAGAGGTASGGAGSSGGAGEGTSGSSEVDTPRRTSLPSASPAVRARVASATRAYVASAAAALPGAWGEQLNARVVGGLDAVGDALDAAVARSVSVRAPRWWSVVGTLQWLLLAALVTGLLWLGAIAVMDYLQLPRWHVPVVTMGALEWPWPSLLAIGAAVLGLVLAGVARVAARVGARRRERAVRAQLRRGIERVAQERLLGDVDVELAALETIRTAATRAAA